MSPARRSARSSTRWAATNSSLGLPGVEPPPVPVRPAVRADRHARRDQLAHAVGVEPARLAEQPGEHEELGPRPRSTSRGSAISTSEALPSSKVRRTSGPAGHRVEHLLELLDAHPGPVLARARAARTGAPMPCTVRLVTARIPPPDQKPPGVISVSEMDRYRRSAWRVVVSPGAAVLLIAPPRSASPAQWTHRSATPAEAGEPTPRAHLPA